MSALAQRLVRLAAQGLTAREACEVEGVARSTARMSLSRLGLRFVAETDRSLWKARDAAADGLTFTEAARLMGKDASSFHRLTRQRGIRFVTHLERIAAVRAEREAQAAAERAREEAARMARWREAWAERKAARLAAPVPVARPRIVDEASLGAAMAEAALRDRIGRVG